MTVFKSVRRAKPDPELLKLAACLMGHYQKPQDLLSENGLHKPSRNCRPNGRWTRQ